MYEFSFQTLKRSDFPILSRWLAMPHVARWWADDPALDAVESQYGGVMDRTEPCEVFIAHLDNDPIGLIQRYRFEDYPQYIKELAPIMPVPDHAYSTDYLIGPTEKLGKGLAAQMIRAFVDEVWKFDPTASCVVIPVNVANRASWRALERAGFHCVASGNLTPDHPIDDPAHYIYQVDRPRAERICAGS
jgi:aminoglycoside 6'-N-acetyltransferase